ncbi:MAG: TonB-dependent receptor [candidate division WOR-3 bacterium]
MIPQVVLLLLSYLPFYFLDDTIFVSAYYNRVSYFRAPYYFTLSQSDNAGRILYSNLLILKGVNYASLSIGGTSSEQNSVSFANIYFPNAMLGYTDISLLPLSIVKNIQVLNSSSPITSLPGIGGTVNLIPETSGYFMKTSKYERNYHALIPISKDFRIGAFLETFVDSYSVNIDGASIIMKNTGFRKYGMFLTDLKRGNSLFIAKREAGSPPPLGGIGEGNKREIIEGFNLTFPVFRRIKLGVNQSAFHQIYVSNYESDTHFVANLRISLEFNKLLLGLSQDLALSTKIGNKQKFNFIITVRNVVMALGHFQFHPSLTMISTEEAKKVIILPGISLSKSISENFFVFSSLSKTYRVPTFNELYWPEDAFARGNPALKPESGLNLDTGFRLLKNNLYITGTLYSKKVKNAILWVQDDKYIPENFSEGEHFGSNITFSYFFKEDVWGELNLNFQRSYLNKLPYIYRPNFSLNSIFLAKFLKLSFTYLGKRPERPNSTKTLDPVYLIDVSIKRNFSIKKALLEFSIGIENLLGKNYTLIPGYPQPGRNFFTEIRLKGGL